MQIRSQLLTIKSIIIIFTYLVLLLSCKNYIIISIFTIVKIYKIIIFA